jgi:pimeloyl-ACP methyl ester carboxylesterase
MKEDNKVTKQKPQPRIPLVFRLIRAVFPLMSRWAPDLSGRVALSIFSKPIRFKSSASEIECRDKSWQKVIVVNGLRIMTYQWGRGDRQVLLLHGWAGRATQFHVIIEELVAKGFRVVALDLPAHGLSEGQTTNLLEIGPVICAVEHEFGKFDQVITHSFGGLCALYASSVGLYLKRLVSIAIPANPNLVLDEFLGKINALPITKEAMLKRVEQLFGVSFLDFGGCQMAGKSAEFPMLIVHDEHDRESSFEHARALLLVKPDAELVATKGLGHNRILRDRQVIVGIIEWMSRQEAATVEMA